MDEIKRKLASGPTIRERIEAALQDEYPYQVIYCNRLEGTTSTIIDIARKDQNIFVSGHQAIKRMYTEQGVRWLGQQNLYILDGTKCHTIILDAVPESSVRKMREALKRMPIKLIAIKNIVKV